MSSSATHTGPATGAGNDPAHVNLHKHIGTVRNLIAEALAANQPAIANVWRGSLKALNAQHNLKHGREPGADPMAELAELLFGSPDRRPDGSERYVGSHWWLFNELAAVHNRRSRVLVPALLEQGGGYQEVHKVVVTRGAVYLLPADAPDAPAPDER